jgi:hypothetical protein
MAKEIRLKLTKTYTLNLKLGKPDISQRGLLHKADLLIKLILSLLLIGFLALEFFTFQTSVSTVKIVYWAIIILLGLQLIKRLFLKGDNFPTYAYDIHSLVVISLVALSLFVNIVISHNQQNIWGLPNLNAFSGISIIVFWFLFYLTAINFADKKGTLRLFLAINLAPAFGLLVFAFNRFATLNQIADVIVILLPGFVWMVLTQKRLFVLSILNTGLAVLMLFFASIAAVVSALSALFFILAITVYNERGHWLAIKLQLDKDTEELRAGKLKIFKYIRSNYQAYFVIISLIVVIIGLFILLFGKYNLNLSQYFVTGGNEVAKQANINTVFFGRGLKEIAGSSIFTMIYAFGVLPIIAYALLLFFVIRDLMLLIRENLGPLVSGKAYFLLSSFITMVIYSVVFVPNSSLVITFWVMLAASAVLIETKKNKHHISNNNTINNLQNIKDESIRDFIQFLQKFLVVSIIGLVCYLLYIIANLL